jgi:hypothetical protein
MENILQQNPATNELPAAILQKNTSGLPIGRPDVKKFCCTEENDETPRIQDLRAPVLCNPPAL